MGWEKTFCVGLIRCASEEVCLDFFVVFVAEDYKKCFMRCLLLFLATFSNI